MQLMIRLMPLSLAHNIHFYDKHIQGVAIVAADLLSRLQVSEFRTDTSSSFPSKDLSQDTELLLRSSLSKSTTSAYKSVFQSYKQFVQFYFSNESHFSPSLQHLPAFIAHYYLTGSAASTVRT